MSELIKLGQIGNIVSNIGNKLVGNQNLLKLIKYDTANALAQTNLTPQEIVNLVGKGSDPKTQQQIFKSPFNEKIKDDRKTELRFFVSRITPNNIYLASLSVVFQTIVYNTLWEMNNDLRPFLMMQEILNELNGMDIGGIGELKLTKPISVVNYNVDFSGYMIELGTRAV